MKIRPDQFVDMAIDPNADPPDSFPPNEFLENMRLDPGLESGIPLPELKAITTANALEGLLVQQQYLVYDVARGMGVLTPFVEPAKLSLQVFDLALDSMQASVINDDITAQTAIGFAVTALSMIPTPYTMIAAAFIQLGLTLYETLAGGNPAPRTYLPCQAWEEQTNAEAFSEFRKYTNNRNDWTNIFLPRYQGELSLQICKHQDGPHGLVWGLGNGQVPHVRKVGSKFEFGDQGEFDNTGGIGMIPGGQRIYSLVQCTPTQYRGQPDSQIPADERPLFDNRGHYLDARGRKGVFEERCGSGESSVKMVDVGEFYPTVAQAGVTLWNFMFQRGAAMYTVDTDAIGDAWIHYFQGIWGGIQNLWANPDFYGSSTDNSDVGYGRGFWEGNLQQLTRHYGVGLGGEIGNVIGSWAPAGCRGPLQSEDQEHFIQGSALTHIILPAIAKLKHTQRWHLQHTTLAAYLPIYGGKNANPLTGNTATQMGAFISSGSLRQEFKDARQRILTDPGLKHQVRLQDVLDDEYRTQIEAAGGGTHGDGPDLGFATAEPYSGVWIPTGGAGFGEGSAPGGRWPHPKPADDTIAWILGGLALAGGAAVAYRYREPLQKWLRQVQRKALPGRR